MTELVNAPTATLELTDLIPVRKAGEEGLKKTTVGDILDLVPPPSGGGGGSGSGDASLLPHRYWRVLFQGSQAFAMVVAELEMRSAPNGPDQCEGGTAIASSVGVGAAASAFDNNNATFWGMNLGAGGGVYYYPGWIGYDFGEPTTVQEIAIRARADAPAQTPPNGALHWSDDGVIYYQAFAFGGATDYAGGEQRVFTSPLVSET